MAGPSAIDPSVVVGAVTANEGTIAVLVVGLLGLTVLIAAFAWIRRILAADAEFDSEWFD